MDKHAKLFCNLTAEDVSDGKRIVWMTDTTNTLFNECAALQVSAHSLPDPDELHKLLKAIEFIDIDNAVTVGLAKKVLTWITNHITDTLLPLALQATCNTPGERGASWTVKWRQYTAHWSNGYEVLKKAAGVPEGADMGWRPVINRPYKSMATRLSQFKASLGMEKHQQTIEQQDTSPESDVKVGELQQRIAELQHTTKQDQQELQNVKQKLHDSTEHSATLQKHLDDLRNEADSIWVERGQFQDQIKKLKDEKYKQEMEIRNLQQGLDYAHSQVLDLKARVSPVVHHHSPVLPNNLPATVPSLTIKAHQIQPYPDTPAEEVRNITAYDHYRAPEVHNIRHNDYYNLPSPVSTPRVQHKIIPAKNDAPTGNLLIDSSGRGRKPAQYAYMSNTDARSRLLGMPTRASHVVSGAHHHQ